jgi:hypothetical protein
MSSYAQSNNITSKQEESDNDVHSVFTAYNSHKIEIWCYSV